MLLPLTAWLAPIAPKDWGLQGRHLGEGVVELLVHHLEEVVVEHPLHLLLLLHLLGEVGELPL